MSQVLITKYLSELDVLKKIGGTHRETVVREAFKDLLKGWGRQHGLVFIPEYKLESPTKETRFVDGALLHELRVPFGYWEAKDAKDNLDAEIEFKFKRGYPQDNIIFEDSAHAVLIQHRREIMRCEVTDVVALEKLLKLFFAYERVEIAYFRRAVDQFKLDLPSVLDALRLMIERAYLSNEKFRSASAQFLDHAKEAINPSLTAEDVREMLIQHVLTEEIFAKVFDSEFHRDNNIARELYQLESTFFTGVLKKNTLVGLEPYYAAIRGAASQIGNHQEKQTFLKVIYENFYKVYNAKAADRLGVVYTPNEIVRFMVEATDWLCERHFGRNLIDRGVEILDPATGTGTFICELLEYFRGQPQKLLHKYREELHANEVAILPYYVANLNIEATYAAIRDEYQEFANLCFVDTLDNVGLHTSAHGVTADLFGSVSEENVARIKRQNGRRISVVIGNPPYNANQANENDNNKNREYRDIDERIKLTYIGESTAQKTKLYDMYARFFRWASDRLDENGIVSFITNRSFIESRTFDGFRKVVAKEFAEIYVIDLGGDIRGNPKLSGTRHNVFGIQTGVAISFLVKKPGKSSARIFYARRGEFETAEEKLSFLDNTPIHAVAFEEVRPDSRGNWINLTSNDFESLLPIASKFTKGALKTSQERAMFKLFSLGVSTSRDDWVYSHDKARLDEKMRALVDVYNSDLDRAAANRKRLSASELTYDIKWTRSVKSDLASGVRYSYQQGVTVRSAYRPFSAPLLRFNGRLVEVQYQQTKIFGEKGDLANKVITFTDAGSQKPFMVLACQHVFDYHFVGAAAAATGVPLYRYDGERREDNITDWCLETFKKRYQPGRNKKSRPITKEAIFHYAYAVLHDPKYRSAYSQNLKREFPRLPLHGDSESDFWTWADLGESLMTLHIDYMNVKPWSAIRLDRTKGNDQLMDRKLQVFLKSSGPEGLIEIDDETTLSGLPASAWRYLLGNRCAIDWVLDQYKVKRSKDPVIRERFSTYRFADYKEEVIDLVLRVTTVSVETMSIVDRIEKLSTSAKNFA